MTVLSKYKPLELVNSAAAHRFELKIGDHIAFIEYWQRGQVITLIHLFLNIGFIV